MYIGIICASLPSLKPFVARHFPNLFKTSPDVLRPRNDRLRFSLLSPITTHLRTWTSRRAATRLPVDEEEEEGEETAVDKSNGSALSDTLASLSDGFTRADTKTHSGVVVEEGGERASPV